ncbi:MAG: type II toxin-antitoxin system RelE/ParE family toxin [Spirochaetia bacterium]|nr:type II toxin-antitoxin system RelE/ParE family toxin [Spirochaetia bacterium]
MIKSFADKNTEAIFNRKMKKGMHPLTAKKALKGLRSIESSIVLDDLKIPPGNNLEALKGDRKGQYSIRVNDQWRICFRWDDGNAYDVEFCDYH